MEKCGETVTVGGERLGDGGGAECGRGERARVGEEAGARIEDNDASGVAAEIDKYQDP